MENEQADAGRDCRTRLARQNSQARTGTGKYLFSLLQLTTSRIGNLTRLTYTLLYVMTIHTYKLHTYINTAVVCVHQLSFCEGRRHHCWQCLKLVCSACSSKKWQFDSGRGARGPADRCVGFRRVYDECYAALVDAQEVRRGVCPRLLSIIFWGEI